MIDRISAQFHARPAQRRKERLRNRIIEIATELYEENGGANGGFENTTVEAIADRADISVRSFFRYFNTKADVIFLDTRNAVADVLTLIRGRLENESVVAAVLGGFIERTHWFVKDPVNRDRLRRAVLAPEFKERLAILQEQERQMISELIAEYLPKTPDRLSTARTISSLVGGTVWDALACWASQPSEDAEAVILSNLNELGPIMEELRKASQAWQVSRLTGKAEARRSKKPTSESSS